MRYAELKKRVRDCIKYGDFTLHSGEKSEWICDLLNARDIFARLMFELDVTVYNYNFGIEFGGALLAASLSEPEYSCRAGIIRKNGDLYFPSSDYYGTLSSTPPANIIDDVVTTEKSFIEAELITIKHNITIGKRLVVLDRRKEKNLEIESLFTAADFGL